VFAVVHRAPPPQVVSMSDPLTSLRWSNTGGSAHHNKEADGSFKVRVAAALKWLQSLLGEPKSFAL